MPTVFRRSRLGPKPDIPASERVVVGTNKHHHSNSSGCSIKGDVLVLGSDPNALKQHGKFSGRPPEFMQLTSKRYRVQAPWS